MQIINASDKIKYGALGVAVGALLAGGVVYAGFMFSSQNSQSPVLAPVVGATSTQGGQVNCEVKTVTSTIQGGSMAGILENGQEVSMLQNYYACNIVARGDIVAYDYPGQSIVKKVMGMPGDTFSLKANGSEWNIVVNGKALLNSEGKPYLLADSDSRMLKYYETSDQGIIPADGYMILGNVPTGSLDSIQFGLVSKNDLLGKINK